MPVYEILEFLLVAALVRLWMVSVVMLEVKWSLPGADKRGVELIGPNEYPGRRPHIHKLHKLAYSTSCACAHQASFNMNLI